MKIKEVREKVKRRAVIKDATEIVAAYRKSNLKRMHLELLDRKYRILPLSVYQDFIKWSGVDRKKYVNEFFDCDEFSCILKAEARRRLQVNGVGEVIDISGRHAYNCLMVLESDGSIGFRTVEPQNDRLIIKQEKMYVATRGSVRF